MTALETGRMRLEPLRADDAGVMFEGLSNTRLYAFIEEEPPASVEALRARYQRLESRLSPGGDESWLNWVILTKPDLGARGYVQATVCGESASIAYVLFEDAWGQGLAKEAVQVMLVHLRDAWSVRTARATVDPRNLRSVRLLERLHFALAQTRRGQAPLRGVLAHEVDYVLRMDT